MPSVLKYSTLIVASKLLIYEIAKKIKISDDIRSIELTTLFPSAYYSSSENIDNFKGNFIKSEPILKFTSKISTARDIIQQNKEIKNVIIFGEDVIKNNLSDLEWVLKRKSVENVIIIAEWNEILSFKHLLNEDNEINIYAWSEESLLSNINLIELLKPNPIESKYNKQEKKLINNYLNKEINVIKIDNDELSLKIEETRNKLKKLIKSLDEQVEYREFLKQSYGLLNIFERIPIPIKYLEKTIDSKNLIVLHPTRTINNLFKISNQLLQSRTNNLYSLLVREIINNLNFIYNKIYNDNPKWPEFIKVIRDIQYKSHLVIVPKSYYIDAINMCFEEKSCYTKLIYYQFQELVKNQYLTKFC